DTEVAWNDLLQQSRLWSAKLHREGLEAETPVAILFDDVVDEFAAALGVLRAGGTCVFLERSASLAAIQQVLANSGARFILSVTSMSAPLSEVGIVLTADSAEETMSSTLPSSPARRAASMLAASVLAEIEEGNLAPDERTLVAEIRPSLAFHDAL